MRAGIIVFPGTNCDRDTKSACEFFGWQTDYIWHDETSLNDYDVIFLPGGFSYGDYIRAGRLAKFSPAVLALKDYVKNQRGFVVGICNGFQTLCETGLLPGILSVNWSTRFICDVVSLKSDQSYFTQDITLPIAHGEGRYIVPENGIPNLDELIFLKYNNNPNGSTCDIAGLYDRKRKIIGMMPHPERAVFEETGSIDGRYIFKMIEADLLCN
jgi:phosphoribosylformylglycinamidine synthase